MDVDRLPFHRRLGFQLGMAIAVVALVCLGVTGYVMLGQERQTLRRELTHRALSEMRSLALASAGRLLRHDPELELHPLINKALAENPDLDELVILDSEGYIQGHRDLLQVGRRMDGPRLGEPLDVVLGPDEEAWLADGEIGLRLPIEHLGQRVGSLEARVSPARIEATLRAAQRRAILVGAAGAAVVLFSVLIIVATHLRALGALSAGVQRIGAGDLVTPIEVDSRNELGMLADLMNSMSEGLATAQHDRIQKERVDRELEIAAELQDSLLPGEITPPRGYKVQAHYTPALEVSGDYYDVIPLDGDHVALVTADVSGKGVPAMVVMAMLRVILRGLAIPDRDPASVLLHAAWMLEGSMRRGMFVTCIYGVLNLQQHTFCYASAGHCPPAVFGKGSARWLSAGGKAIGMFPPAVLSQSIVSREIELDPGEGLLLYTDGLVESMNADREQLGFDLALRELSHASGGAAMDAVSRLRACVERHRAGVAASDDLTMIALQRETVSESVTEEVLL